MPGVNQTAVRRLIDRARRDIDAGILPSCQLALARSGEIELFETFGSAANRTPYLTFSSVKPLLSMLVLGLAEEGRLKLELPVMHYLPEFGANGKEHVTVAQVMLHTCGFPRARMSDELASTSAGRRQAFAGWHLSYPAGSRFDYHAESAHWVLAEIVEAVTGAEFRAVLHARVTGRLGLPNVLDGARVNAPLMACGAEATASELRAAFGVSHVERPAVTLDGVMHFDDPVFKALASPGGGGIMTAAELATFYCEILTGCRSLWSDSTRELARSDVRNELPDATLGCPTRRTVAFVVAGADGHASLRGFGRAGSPRAFGHNGAKGQIAWADPDSGLVFVYFTNGMDRNVVRDPRRTTALCSLASACAAA
jgi:CubicO group peptidase (beta-lactamase class C family)